jgi:hypothetical protein
MNERIKGGLGFFLTEVVVSVHTTCSHCVALSGALNHHGTHSLVDLHHS